MSSDEKREFPRMVLNCAMEYRQDEHGERFDGTAINISSTGILFVCDRKLSVGDRVEVKVPSNLPVPVLRAIILVNRVETDKEGNGYRVAGQIEEKINS